MASSASSSRNIHILDKNTSPAPAPPFTSLPHKEVIIPPPPGYTIPLHLPLSYSRIILDLFYLESALAPPGQCYRETVHSSENTSIGVCMSLTASTRGDATARQFEKKTFRCEPLAVWCFLKLSRSVVYDFGSTWLLGTWEHIQYATPVAEIVELMCRRSPPNVPTCPHCSVYCSSIVLRTEWSSPKRPRTSCPACTKHPQVVQLCTSNERLQV